MMCTRKLTAVSLRVTFGAIMVLLLTYMLIIHLHSCTYTCPSNETSTEVYTGACEYGVTKINNYAITILVVITECIILGYIIYDMRRCAKSQDNRRFVTDEMETF